MRRPLLLRVIVLGVAVLLGGTVVAGASGLQTPDGDRVRWHDGLESVGRDAAAMLPAVRRDVDRRLRLPVPRGVAEIVLLSGHAAMRDEARAAVPPWAVGVTQGASGRILLRADLLQEGVGGGLWHVLRHEWVHLAWAQRAGVHARRLPLWVEEGIAEEIGGGMSLDLGAALDLAAAQDRLLPLATLADGFPADAVTADLAYKQGRSWVRFLVERKGWDALLAVLDDVARSAGREGDAFGDAVRERTGRGVGEWEIAWRESARESARPWFHLLLSDVSGAILTALAVASLGLFVVLLRRRRRQIAALEVGELPEPE